MKSYFPKVLLYIIAVFFIVSAVSKLFPVIQFEFLLGSFAIPWSWTPYVARTIIAIELIIGFLLLFRFKLVRISIPLSIRFLLFMILVLFYRWYTAGADAECGCMGDWLSMTPLQSILKNVLLIAVLWWARRGIQLEQPSNKRSNFFVTGLVLVSAVVPFVIEPVYIGPNTSRDQQSEYPLDIDLFYSDNQSDKPGINLKEGKHVIAFLSINCPHCQLAAEKIGIMQLQYPDYPFYFFINGEEDEVQAFRKEHKCESVRFSKLLQPQFLQLSGPTLPSIQFIKDGRVIRTVDYLDLDNRSMEAFLR